LKIPADGDFVENDVWRRGKKLSGRKLGKIIKRIYGPAF
jgi:hypothetical protein